MKTKTEITYFAEYGIDSRHLWECKPFDKLKDAKNLIENLPLAPSGKLQAFRLTRREEIFEKLSHGKYKMYPISSNDKILDERII